MTIMLATRRVRLGRSLWRINKPRLAELLALCLFACSLPAAALPFLLSGAAAGPDGQPAGWTTWSARAETAPHCFVDPLHYRSHPGSLAITGASNLAEHGGWQHLENGVEAGKWYRFAAYYLAESVASENWQIVARLDWRNAQGSRVGYPDYANHVRRDGAWTQLSIDTQAPPDAVAVELQLYLSNAPAGTVWWDDVSLNQIPAPAPRPVRIASVNLRPPYGSRSVAENVQQFVDFIEKSINEPTDVILLPEGITVVGTDKTFADVAELVPGPTTQMLGALAKMRHTYIVAGLYEREGRTLYNTAVLIDREGNVAGKYRKVYLPREEIEGGVTPGSDYPVFHTDFGTVGMMICYDEMFPDPARELTARGVDIILLPIWGGDETLTKARAIENKVFLVSSGYDFITEIVDPDGTILSATHKDGTIAQATIDLSKRYVDSWLGEMHSRRMREMRLDIPRVQPGLEH
jgi:predicted amidohydrolase